MIAKNTPSCQWLASIYNWKLDRESCLAVSAANQQRELSHWLWRHPVPDLAPSGNIQREVGNITDDRNHMGCAFGSADEPRHRGTRQAAHCRNGLIASGSAVPAQPLIGRRLDRPEGAQGVFGISNDTVPIVDQ